MKELVDKLGKFFTKKPASEVQVIVPKTYKAEDMNPSSVLSDGDVIDPEKTTRRPANITPKVYETNDLTEVAKQVLRKDDIINPNNSEPQKIQGKVK